MAATGLLGINPYQQGVNIDISSKPMALAFQIEQKEAAKRDALQKYLMDYEKSLNSAGMRNVDQDAFLATLNQAKEYNLKNTEKILNPAKYGSEWQSNYLGMLKKAQSLIEESKVQAADDKVANEHIYRATQEGKTIQDGLMPAIEASRLSIVDPRFKKINPWELKFDEKYDDNNIIKNVWGNITLPTRVREEKLPDGRILPIKESYITDEIKEIVPLNGIKDYKMLPGAARYYNEIAKNPAIYDAANKEFGEAFATIDPVTGTKIKPEIGDDINNFIAGYVLSKKPVGNVSADRAEYDWLTKFNMQQAAANKRQQISEGRADARYQKGQQPQGPMMNLLDTIPNKDFAVQGGGYVKLQNGMATKDGNPWTGTIDIEKTDLPGELYSVILKGFEDSNNKIKKIQVHYDNGVPDKFTNPKTGIFTRESIERYQKKYDSERKGESLFQKNKSGSNFKLLPASGKFD
jgi:hypothetical protein